MNVAANASRSAAASFGSANSASVNLGKGFPAATGLSASAISIIVTIIVLMAVIALYYQTIGYYIQLGWDKLTASRMRGETVDISVPGTGLSAQLQPASGAAAGSSISASSSGILNRIESDVESALGGGGKKEVFNVAHNVYTYHDAEPLCQAFGAELASYDQVKEAYAAGADWCNYGWIKGQLAVYPTQPDTYKKLQRGNESERMSCGRPGVNGGYFPNPEQRFGVTCYGPRPVMTALDERLQMEGKTDTSYDRRVNHYKGELDSIPVNPWSHKQWSST